MAMTLCVTLCAGCTALPATEPMTIQPVLRISHSAQQTAATWYQLGKYHQQRGQFDLARAAYAESMAQDPARRNQPAPEPAMKQETTPAAVPDTAPAPRMELVQLAPHVYRLKLMDAPAKPPPAPTAMLVSTVKSPSGPLRVAIANGSGMPGMTQRIAHLLAQRGIKVSQFRSERSYRQQRTEIQYPRGHEKEALALNHALKGLAVLVRRPSTPAHPNLRLVLGQNAALASALRIEFRHALAAN
jgi:hypothetical protein